MPEEGSGFSTFSTGSGRKITDEQRAKLEASFMYPSKPDGKHTIRNEFIKGNLPPQNFVQRRYKRDWDPAPSYDVDWFTRQHLHTAEQAKFLSSFDRDMADERYINRPQPPAPPLPGYSQGEGLHRTADDTHPMGANGKMQDTYSPSCIVNKTRDDMWREQAKYERDLGADTHSNRFQMAGRDRSSGLSQPHKEWAENRLECKEPTWVDHNTQDNVPQDYRSDPLESAMGLVASGQNKALLDEINMRQTPDASGVTLRSLRPYSETNGRGMNKVRDPNEVLYATMTGTLGLVAGDGAPTLHPPPPAGAICRTSRGAYEGSMSMNPWQPLHPRMPGSDKSFPGPLGMYPTAHPREMAYARPPSPFAMPLNCGRTVGY